MEKLYIRLTDLLPIIGGASGAASQVKKLSDYFPEAEVIISTIILSAIGAAIGYLVKLLLDKIFKKRVQNDKN